MRRVLVCSAAIVCGLWTGALYGAPGSPPAAPALSKKLDSKIRLLDRLRAPLPRAPNLAPSRTTPIPVVVQLSSKATPADLARLELAGFVPERGAKGEPLGRGTRLAGQVSLSDMETVAADAGVVHVSLDGRPFSVPRPLDLTTRLIHADDAHRQETLEGIPLTGRGITICDVDSGIDVMHPMLFRADGGFFDWNDVNMNGVLDPGVDSVDLDGNTYILRSLNGVVSNYYDPAPLFGTEEEGLDLRYDYLYADMNDDGSRNVGSKFGFTEDSPSLGEPLFVVDDVDDSGSVDDGEKIVALKTPKVKAFRVDQKIYRRGVNLLQAPWDESMQHGNGAVGVMVGGQFGFRKLAGLAPDADIVIATDERGGREFTMTSFCVSEGARVVLHEYAPWIGYHFDGSSDLEQLIDETAAENVVHVNPVGNLSGSQKEMKVSSVPGTTTPITFEVPQIGATYVIVSMLWRDPSRSMAFTLKTPSGEAFSLPVEEANFSVEVGDFTAAGFIEVSDRGTAKLDVYLYPRDVVVPLPAGNWTLDAIDNAPAGSGDMVLLGHVFDEISGWGQGVRFLDHVTEDHLIGWPATADKGIAVAAFTGHEFAEGGVTGQRAGYSGRGRRLDGTPMMWISAPDNPIVPARFAERPLSYMIYGGTSGASPHVAGTAALVFAEHPELTGLQVRDRIRDSALVDDQTGEVPNDDFGYGKLDTYGAIFGEPAVAGATPEIVGGDFEVPVGPHQLGLTVSDEDDYARDLVLEVDRDYDGVYDEVLKSPMLEVNYAEPGRHILKVRVKDLAGRTDVALVRLQVVADTDNAGGAGGGAGDGEIHAGGGGCSAVAPGPISSSGWATLAALSVVMGRAGARRRQKTER